MKKLIRSVICLSTFAISSMVDASVGNSLRRLSVLASIKTGKPGLALEQLMRRFALPNHLQTMLRHAVKKPSDYRRGQDIFYHSDTHKPLLYVKNPHRGAITDVSRVINAERLRRCIDQFGLSKVAVRPNYMHCMPDGTWVVVTEAVEALDPWSYRFPVAQMQELGVIAEETGYKDWRNGMPEKNNLIIDRYTRKATIIDTEDCSFQACHYEQHAQAAGIAEHTRVHDLYSLIWFLGSMHKDSRLWWQERLSQLQSLPDAVQKRASNDLRKKFDDPNDLFPRAQNEYLYMIGARNSAE